MCRRARRLWLSRMCCPPAVVIFGPFMFGASANIFLNLCPLCRLLRSTWMVVANTLLSSRHAWSLLGFVHLTIQMEQKRAYGESRPRTTRSANYPTNLPSHGSESARIRRSAACRMCTVGLPDCRSFMCVLSVHVYSVLYGVDDWYQVLAAADETTERHPPANPISCGKELGQFHCWPHLSRDLDDCPERCDCLR